MDKARIMALLSPFINGEVPRDREVPRDERWYDKLSEISELISDSEVDLAIPILEDMYYDPSDPDSKPESAIPGAHGIYQILIARRRSLRTRERE